MFWLFFYEERGNNIIINCIGYDEDYRLPLCPGGGAAAAGGGGGVGASAAIAATAATAPAAPQLDLGFVGAGAEQTGPIQAFVLSENVSNAQQANQLIEDQATLWES